MSVKLSRRELAKIGLGLGAATALGRAAFAQAPAFFRIGTGGTAGTYYPIGGLIAEAGSNPPPLVLPTPASNGSVADVKPDAARAPQSGFTPAGGGDLGHTGTRPV